MIKANLYFLSCILILSSICTLRAQERVGGIYHAQAMESWKEFNNGHESSEDDLKYFLTSKANSKEVDQYMILACDKGSADFCYTAAWSNDKNKRKAAPLYAKGCKITHNLSECMTAMKTYLEANNINEAKSIFLEACSINDDRCDWTKSRAKKKFIQMIKEACKDGHQVSCSILESHKIKHN